MRNGTFKAVFAAAVLGIAAAGGAEIYYQTQGPETVRVTVTDKERQVTSNGESTSSKYIVFTDKEVFENTDSFLRGKFNSSDVQGSLERGKEYDLTVYGFRNHFFSVYRNIISATPVQQPAAPRAPGS